jgi:hypothetical protein
MRFPRMTTRRWMIAVAVAAVWFSFVAYAGRLRKLSVEHMTRSARAMAEAAGTGSQYRPTPRSDWHLKMARKCEADADLIEAFCLAVPLVAALLALALHLIASLQRNRRARPVVTRSEAATRARKE